MKHPSYGPHDRPQSLVFVACLALSCVQVSVDPDFQDFDAMSAPAHVHHDINYIELTVHDMGKAQAFYTAAFGWTFNDYGPEYAGIRRGEGEAGGLRLDAQASPAKGGAGVGVPLVILYSADLDATVVSVRAAGGEIITEPYDFPGGQRFHFLDPSGNELAVWAAP